MYLLLEVLLFILILQTIGFGLSVWLGRNSVADVLWGFLIALGALYIIAPLALLILNTNPVYLWLNPVTLSGILIMIWGFRLAWHIGTRFIKKDKEDPRYAAMSQNWRCYYLRSYGQVFLLQGLLMIFMLSGLIVMASTGVSINFYTLLLGTTVWALGLAFEIIADKQLTQFIKHKQPGQIMQQGLWRYSRHPNYFGEVTLWWGLWIITLPTPYWYLTLIAPLTNTFLILKVSGVPMAEERYADNKSFQDYAKRTNKFFPWWPKS